MKRASILVIAVALISLSAMPVSAQETPEDPAATPALTPEEATQKAAELKTTADQAAAAKQQAEERVQSAESKVTELQQMLLKLQRDLQQAQNQLKQSEEALPKQQEAAQKAAADKQAADKAAEDAAKALAEAQKKADEAKANAETATKAADTAAAEVKTTQEAIAAARQTITETEAGMTQANEQVAAVQTELNQASEALAAVTADWLAKARAVEETLQQGGLWVSFRREVAPIFYDRCLACHNARMAKGRFNMESYAAIMKGGESGPAVEPGDGEFSNLCLQIEDGSMPKDADPLTAEQIAVIKKWVALGAKLDAGVSPEAPLLEIMPKFPQPDPPEAYPVAIPVTALDFSPDGQVLASSGYHELILWNPADHQVIRRIWNVAERVYDVEFHGDGQRIAIASGTPGQTGEVKIFNIADGALLADLVTVEDAMFGVAFSPDGARLAACGADRSLRVFDVATGEEQIHVEDHADWVMDVAWSPDGTRLVTASRDKTAKVFDASTGDALTTFNGHGEPVYSAAFLADGNQIATGGRDKQVRIWQTADAKEVRKIGGFGNEVLQVEVLADNRLFSCSADKTARLHNAADGAAVKTFSGHTDWVYSLTVHAESGRLASGSYDGEIRIWNIEDAQTILNWVAAPGLDAGQAAAN
ncbi:MAG: hypothetical protein DWQ34_05675 [Planctomycetota bacterium]|nr:MAG: hypothetical protein DWQ29_03865 [Planctomycetota bacterium]REJ95535.1 MAG: hypothetical protein DWQ34_05675 [Planctomycetota bacterium]REK21921.1 MAG: hypothetical protein DWQ41_20145 [Planctomycetota bacterium]REK32167.1 MAG: hypothetical protein DWQ45_17650 [Planctomycetota bacterium]